MSLTWVFIGVIAFVCVLAWAGLAAFFAQRAPQGRAHRPAVAAAILVMPVFVIAEVWFLALAVGGTWQPLPWVIAGGGGLALAVSAPLIACDTRRMPATMRTRAFMNLAIIVLGSTVMAEIFAFVGTSRSAWPAIVLFSAATLWTRLQRRKIQPA